MQRKNHQPARTAALLRRLLLAGIVLCIGINAWMTLRCADRVHYDAAAVPPSGVGLVLGTSRMVGGRENAHFRVRIDAAAELYRAGKVRHFLLSGDNQRPDYNEPRDMKDALVEMGVPADIMTLDPLGLRTLDSVIRARRKFGVADCVIISDDFHLPRAIWLADRHGIKATAYVGRRLPWSVSGKTRVREWLARLGAVVDEVSGSEPPIEGGPVPLPPAALGR
jgi:SanA protein